MQASLIHRGLRSCAASALVVVAATSAEISWSEGTSADQSSTSSAATSTLGQWIDGRVEAYLAASQTPPPPLVDDATFLRRVYLDLHGTIPTVAQARDFLDDPAPEKRSRLVDRLLLDDRSSAHLARTWRRILLPSDAQTGPMGIAFESWLRDQFAADSPFDRLARQIVTAGGAEDRSDSGESDDASDNAEDEDDEDASRVSGAVAYLQAAGADPASVAGAISRDFLGVRIECAQCHDHPFADWKQDQFWGIAAFFAGARFNQPSAPVDGRRRDEPPRDEQVTTISPPDIGKTFAAEFLWSDQPVEAPDDGGERLPRQLFAQWLTAAENPHFAATAVNRVWRQLCGRGLTQSVDDLDAATEDERDAVLDELAMRFAQGRFDLKWLIGGICKSRAYQFAAEGAEPSSALVGVRPLKALSPEQVFDALETAVGLPVSRIDQGPRFNGERDQMVARLGEAASKAPEEFRGGVPQMLMLMNGTVIVEAVDLESSRTLRAVVEAPFLDDAEKLDVLFLATLTRHPTDAEKQQLGQHVQAAATSGKQAMAYAEILWALVNGPEFVLLR
jgi:hypothetical protein